MSDVTDKLVQAMSGPAYEGYRLPPEPYNERAVPAEERDWVYDYGERAVPVNRGFVTDFVYHTRGYETPTLSTVWSALFLLSSAVKREAWVKWHPRPLFPNLYMIVIGPAGRVKKTTAVADLGLPILEQFPRYITDVNIAAMKKIAIMKDKATPEALLDGMLPENRPGDDHFLLDDRGEFIKDRQGKALVYRKTSETAIVISELSTFLTKRSYGEGTLQLLIDLYDCRDEWEWRTKGQGVKKLKNTYTTFMAGTTVDGMRSSIPEAAMGDGFMSRTIPVYVPYTKRKYPYPHLVKGAPDTQEMAKRLAWVVTNAVGEYGLSPEADREYQKWYQYHHRSMDDNPGLSGAMSRMSTNLLKVALMFRLNRYEAMFPVIELCDLEDAIQLMDVTYSSMPFLLSQLDPDVIMMESGRIYDLIKRKKRVKRKYCLASLRLKSEVLTAVIEELIARGVIAVEFEGTRYMHAGGRTEEEYVYLEEQDDRNREDRGPGAATSLSYTGTVWDDPNGCFDPGSDTYGVKALDADAQYQPPKPSRGPHARTVAQAEVLRKVRKVVERKPRGSSPKKHKGDSKGHGLYLRPNKNLPVQAKEDEEELHREDA